MLDISLCFASSTQFRSIIRTLKFLDVSSTFTVLRLEIERFSIVPEFYCIIIGVRNILIILDTGIFARSIGSSMSFLFYFLH